MEKAYNPKQYEDTLYKKWEESGYFNPDNLPGEREPYAIMMPPPNVTGVLHLGHALENSLMDIQVRFQRMNGKAALLVPGTDHAAVATQARVEDNLKKEGIANPREHFGREGLLEKIREYAEDSKATILNQIRKMGTSADWSRLAYTFDEERSRVVSEVFKKMYDDGLIYRGHRIVNWSVEGQSTASDDELEYKERTTTLYTFKYAKDFPIPIASVLPETKLGDTAVAVHPEDERYKQYIGQTFTVDVGAQKPLTIHIIADEHVDPKYGTGALGVTPAHSMADFEMYEKQPEIGLIQVVGTDGKMTAAAGEAYAGLPYKEAREKFVQWLRSEGLMIAEEEITHNVSLSDRFKDEIWALPMDQWFIDVNKEIPGRGKSLKALMREAAEKIDITPDRFAKVYTHWIDNLHDWCISRQIWWGHRIPIWYRGEEMYCGLEAPEGDGWIQDEDTLDTWFSSGMWTFSTLGWPNNEDFAKFHPTAWMQMGHEIVFLWMARMILFSEYMLSDIPFRDVYIHGILRDKDGRKFSKSLGNGIDPLDVIEEYGTDALRFSLIKGISPGNDARFYEEKVADARNFVNKLWNVSRFVLMKEEEVQDQPAELSLADKWILSRRQNVVAKVSGYLKNYNFSRAAESIYEFVWNDFADWYIEITKFQPNTQLTREVLETVLKLAHPFIPFVTEQIWKELGHEELLIIAQWPTVDRKKDYSLVIEFDQTQEIIRNIRNIRAQYRIDPAQRLPMISALAGEEKQIVEHLARVEGIEAMDYSVSASVVVGQQTITIPLDGSIDVEKERERLNTEIAQLEQYILGLEKKLANESYIQNAPEAIVHETREVKLAKEQEILALHTALEGLTKGKK